MIDTAINMKNDFFFMISPLKFNEHGILSRRNVLEYLYHFERGGS